MYRINIGAAAKAAGIAVDTVRYYEREGLLLQPQRSAAGYRQFDRRDVERLQFIRRAKALGFTLSDIAELLRLQDGGGSRSQVRAKARERIANLDHKIRELTAIREALSALEEKCHGRGSIAGCPIIEGVQAVSIAPTLES